MQLNYKMASSHLNSLLQPGVNKMQEFWDLYGDQTGK